jgi:hypothetical protein
MNLEMPHYRNIGVLFTFEACSQIEKKSEIKLPLSSNQFWDFLWTGFCHKFCCHIFLEIKNYLTFCVIFEQIQKCGSNFVTKYNAM